MAHKLVKLLRPRNWFSLSADASPIGRGSMACPGKKHKNLCKNTQMNTPLTLYSSPSPHPTTKNSQQMIIWLLFSWYRYTLKFYVRLFLPSTKNLPCVNDQVPRGSQKNTKGPPSSPSMTTLPPKNQCRLCSELPCRGVHFFSRQDVAWVWVVPPLPRSNTPEN